jgi:hypothetical protein
MLPFQFSGQSTKQKLGVAKRQRPFFFGTLADIAAGKIGINFEMQVADMLDVVIGLDGFALFVPRQFAIAHVTPPRLARKA